MRSVDLRNGEVVVRSVVQGALVGLQRHQVDPCERLKAYGTVFEDDFGLLQNLVGLHAEGGAQHAHAQFVGGHDERGGFVPRHLEEGRAGYPVTLRCVGPKASGSVSFVRALSHTCVPSSSVTVVTASPVFS